MTITLAILTTLIWLWGRGRRRRHIHRQGAWLLAAVNDEHARRHDAHVRRTLRQAELLARAATATATLAGLLLIVAIAGRVMS